MKIKLSPLTLIIINILVPVFLFLGKGMLFEFFCMLIGFIVLILYSNYKECLYFLIFYSILHFIIALMNLLSLNAILLLFSTFFYIIKRMLPIMMVSWVLVKNIKSNELLSALEEVHLPKKIILSVAVALRFFPTYKMEIQMIRESLKMRNIHISPLQPLNYLEFWLVPLLIRASMIAEEMTATAITKGVEVPVRRTSFYHVKMRTIDYLFLAVTLSLFTFFLLGGEKLAGI